MNKLAGILVIFLVFITAFNLGYGRVYAQANPNPLDAACQNSEGNAQTQDTSNPSCNQAKGQGDKDPIAGPGGLINTAANIVALIAGIAAVIMIVLGGIGFMTSSGDAQKAAIARNRIMGGIIGLVVIAMAWAIIGMVTGKIIR